MSVESETEALMQIASRCTLFKDEKNEAYAQITGGDHRCYRVDSPQFKKWLRAKYFAEYKAAVTSNTAVSNATKTLEAKALYEDVTRRLGLRVHDDDNTIWLDLCRHDGAAVRITPAGWTVESNIPPVFRRNDHMRDLPLPQRGTSATRLTEFMNLQDEQDRVLLLSWIALAFVSGIPRPLLALTGTQGAAKTTAAKMIRRLIDPSVAELLPPVRSDKEFAQILDHHALPTFDNVGRLNASQADAFCRAVTGGSFSKRKLRTDEDDVVFTFRRPILMTAVNIPTSAPDLVDRLLVLELRRISCEERRDEAALWRAYDEALPGLLGGFLDVVSGVLARRAENLVTAPERMADFMRLGAVAAEALGYGADAFTTSYRRACAALLGHAADTDAVAVGIRRLLATDDGYWTGTATELLGRLHVLARSFEVKDLPRNPAELGKHLRYLIPALQNESIRVELKVVHGRTGRRITLATIGQADIALAPPQTERDAGSDYAAAVTA